MYYCKVTSAVVIANMSCSLIVNTTSENIHYIIFMHANYLVNVMSVFAELHAQLVSNQYHITELVEENKSK